MAEGDDELRALVERARRRDPDAWEELYRRSHGRLIAYAGRRLPGRDQAEDAVSEAMARALDGLDRFVWQGAGFDAWLYGILRNVVLEMGRVMSRAAVQAVPDQPSPASGPLDLTVRADEATMVRHAFERLSAEDQEVLELRVVGELDADAVGTVIGKRAGAVRTAQSRALARLRALLVEGGDFDDHR